MAKKPLYAQCHLRRDTETGTVETTSYIPAKHAKVGRVLDLKEPDKTWSRDWVVMSAGQITDNPPDSHELIKGHRKMTGDALPRRKEG
jgi:hypothetical protein